MREFEYKYVVVLLDRNSNEITSDLVPNLKDAKKSAKYLLSEDYAKNCETTHEKLETRKVEIQSIEKGDCVADFFY